MASSRNSVPNPRRMVATDALFWYAESAMPQFRPIIAGLYVLEHEVAAEQIDACIQKAVRGVPRLRKRVLEMPLHIGLPEWVEDEHFDLAYHVRHMSLPPGGNTRALLDLTAALFATPLDRERPLWEVYSIQGFANGRAVLFFKMHHALVDGVGSLAITEAMTQAEPRKVPPGKNHHQWSKKRPPHPSASARIARLVAHNARETVNLARRAVMSPLRIARHPLDTIDGVSRAVRGLRGVVSDLATPPVKDPISVEGSGLSRRFDIIDIPIARLKAIKKALGVTLNDVVLTALAGTLGRYHRRRRAHVDSLNCMVPMNLRSRSEKDVLGNRVGNFTIVLPVSEKQAAKRLDLIVSQTRAAKADQRGASYPLLVESLTMIPGAVLRWFARQSIGKINVACTNIPGIADARYLADARIEAIYPFASVVEGTPIVMALFSYGDVMNIGIDTDPEAIPDPHEITELFETSLAELESLAGIRSMQSRVSARTATP